MKTSDFDYYLPEAQIAQMSVEPRDSSRLLVLGRETGKVEHRNFYNIGEYLRAGDVLVMNDTKVFKARLRGIVDMAKGAVGVEIFLVRPVEGGWKCLAKPGKKLRVGSVVRFAEGVVMRILEKRPDGTVIGEMRKDAEFGREGGQLHSGVSMSADEVIAFADRVGEIPVPPYVKTELKDVEQYQTAVARETGSVAAPTAAFHFTPRLIEELKAKGVVFAFVTLHVGLGTFLPVKTETLEEHIMHEEWVEISAETVRAIATAKAEGRRVIAVGTTTTRVLEGVAAMKGAVDVYKGDVNIFIYPGFPFRVIDGLITNFHLPKSTLLALVSAFAGRERVLHAYEEAVRLGYRFFSFGDGMLVL